MLFCQIFSRLFEEEINEKIFVGLQIRSLINDRNFETSMNISELVQKCGAELLWE